MPFLKSASVGLVSGGDTVTVTGSVNCTYVVPGTAVFINGALFEGKSGTNFDGSGNSTITLSENYTGGTIVAGTLMAFNTFEGMTQAIREMRDLSISVTEIRQSHNTILTGVTATVTVPVNGVDTVFTPYQYLADQITALIATGTGASDTLTALQATMDTLQTTVDGLQAAIDADKQAAADSATAAAGSAGTASTDAGTATTGAATATTQAGLASTSAGNAATSETNTEGFKDLAEAAQAAAALSALLATDAVMGKVEFDALAAKRISDGAGSGSDTDSMDFALAFTELPATANTTRLLEQAKEVAGVKLHIPQKDILYPSAPDGLDKTDGTGRHTDLTTAITAGTTALSQSVLSRKDFKFTEVFYERISMDAGVDGFKDWFIPFGDVHTPSTFAGVAGLVNNYIAQGYSAHGDWDTTTTGYGKRWSLMTADEQALAVQDPRHNIYKETVAGVTFLVQVRYRIRVVKGLGDTWDFQAYGIRAESNSNFRLRVQGAATTVPALGAYVTSTYTNTQPLVVDTKAAIALKLYANDGADTALSHTGFCYLIPIALVQRRNQGAGHPLNPNGCARIFHTTGVSNYDNWHTAGRMPINSLSDAFDIGTFPNTGLVAKVFGGNIADNASGRWNGDGKFYDAIYAEDVEDLRMSSRKESYEQALETYVRKAIAAEIRGYDSVPFSNFFLDGVTGATTGLIASGFSAVTVADASIPMYDWMSRTGGTTNVPTVCHGSVIIGGIVYKVQAAMRHSTLDTILYLQLENLQQVDATGLSVETVLGNMWSSSDSANPTWTDIIGTPANIMATFPNGVEGQWIPVIPDGTSKTFRFNRKLEAIGGTIRNVVYSVNNGVSWATINDNASFNTTTNSFTIADPATILSLIHYKTQAHFTEDAVNSKVLDLGNVFCGGDATANHGIVSSLIGKVPTNLYGKSRTSVDLNEHFIIESSGVLHTSTWYVLSHDNISVDGTGPTVKVLDYLTENNGKLRLNFVYKEMVYDPSVDNGTEFIDKAAGDTAATVIGTFYHITSGTFQGYYRAVVITGIALTDGRHYIDSDGNIRWENGDLYYEKWDGNGWGDDDMFQVGNNQAVMKDDNNNDVKFGQGGFDLPYFS